MRSRLNQVGRARRGALMVAVIVVLIIIATLTMAFARKLVSQGKAARVRSHHRQAVWLAESGLERATAQLRLAADFEGETWTIPAEQLHGGGEVVIQIAAAEASSPRRVIATARYPLTAAQPATAVATYTLETPSGDGT